MSLTSFSFTMDPATCAHLASLFYIVTSGEESALASQAVEGEPFAAVGDFAKVLARFKRV